MDTRDLKVFVAVYETKSITRAAKDQFLSPQGCSKIIQKIEGELGTSLFARNHFGVAPTPQGDALYRRAQMVIRLLDGVKDEVEAARALKYTLNIASTRGVSEYLSTLKSEAYPVPLLENDILLTADTVVLAGGEFRMKAEGSTWHGGEILGKPRDRDDARRMLKILSGAHHLVTTGVTLRSAARMTHFTSLTYVWFRTLTDEEIAYYVDTFQPFDKAGAYGIQEWIGYAAIERIEGSFYNVMGLPVQKVYTELDKFLNP